MKHNDIHIYARICGYLAFIGSGIFAFIVIAFVLIPNLNQQISPTLRFIIGWMLLLILVSTIIIILWSIGLLLFTLGTTLKQSDNQNHRIAPKQPYTLKRLPYLWLQFGLWSFRISIFITLLLFIIVFFHFVDIRTGYCQRCVDDPIYIGGGWVLTFMGVVWVFGICLEHIFHLSYRLLINSRKNYTHIIIQYPQLPILLKWNWIIIVLNVIAFLFTVALAVVYILWFITTPRITLWDLALASTTITGWFCVMAVGYTLYLNQRNLMITRAIQHQLKVITLTTPSIKAPSFKWMQLLAIFIGISMLLVIIGLDLMMLAFEIIIRFEYGGNMDSNLTILSTLMMVVPCCIVLIAFGELMLIVRHLAHETYINHDLLNLTQSHETIPSQRP